MTSAPVPLIQRQDPRKTCHVGQQRCAERTCRHPLNRVLMGLLATSRADNAAVGLHDVKGRRGADLGVQPRLDLGHIAAHARLDERVDERRDRALVLAVLGQDSDEIDTLAFGCKRVSIDACAVRGRRWRRRAENTPRYSRCRDRETTLPPPRHRPDRMAPAPRRGHRSVHYPRTRCRGHDAPGLDLARCRALRHALAGDLEQMLEAAGDDQAQARKRAWLGQQRVGGDGRAV